MRGGVCEGYAERGLHHGSCLVAQWLRGVVVHDLVGRSCGKWELQKVGVPESWSCTL